MRDAARGARPCTQRTSRVNQRPRERQRPAAAHRCDRARRRGRAAAAAVLDAGLPLDQRLSNRSPTTMMPPAAPIAARAIAPGRSRAEQVMSNRSGSRGMSSQTVNATINDRQDRTDHAAQVLPGLICGASLRCARTRGRRNRRQCRRSRRCTEPRATSVTPCDKNRTSANHAATTSTTAEHQPADARPAQRHRTRLHQHGSDRSARWPAATTPAATRRLRS